MVLIQSLAILLLTAGFVLLLFPLGNWLAGKLGLDVFPESTPLKFAQSFVLASSVFYLVVTVASLFGIGFKWTVYPMLAGLLWFGCAQLKSGRIRFPWGIMSILLLFALCNAYRALTITDFDPNYVHQHPFFSIGNLNHSYRAGNISTYIYQHDQVPLLNQHLGQSILASLPSIFGLHAPQLALLLWQGIILGILCVSVYGLLRLLATRAFCLLGVALLLFMNSTLYSAQLSFTDNYDSPLFFSNNDAALSIITFLYTFFVARRILSQRETSPVGPLGAIGVVVVAWNVYASQNIPVFLVMVALLWAFRPSLAALKRALLLVAVVAVGTLAGKNLGGMFNSRYDVAAAAAIPGVMQFSSAKGTEITVTEPRVKFVLSGERLPALALLSQLRPLTQNNYHLGLDYNTLQDLEQLKFYLQKAWRNPLAWAGRILALSDLVFLAVLQLVLFRLLDPPNYGRWAALMPVGDISGLLALFLVCLTIPSVVVMNGYSWEMSKFFIAALFTGKVINVALVILILRSALQGTHVHKAVAVSLILLMVIFILPCLANYHATIARNHFTRFADRIAVFVRSNEMVIGK